MKTLLTALSERFGRIEVFWEEIMVRRYLGPVMVLVYLLTIGVIELNRRGLLPPGTAGLIPRSHIDAVHVAFSFLLLVLISLGYSSLFPVVFRNSGFAVATVLLRVGITAPAYYDVGLGIAAALYAMGITLAYNLHVQGSDKQG
jgi:hypothetical protein